MSSIRKLAVQFSHFFSSSMLAMLLGLITFPILTRLLSQAEYGMLGIITTTVSLAVVAAKGGISDGIIRFYRDFADTDSGRTEFTSTVVLRGVLLASIVTAAYLLLLPAIMRTIDIDASFRAEFLVMALYLWARPLNIIVYNYLRALGRTIFYNVTGLICKIVQVALSLVLLIYVVRDLSGYFLGIAITEFAFGIFLYGWMLKNYRVRLGATSSPLAWQLVRFGAPLLATELAYLLLRSVDRYLVQLFLGEAATGVYSVGYTLPGYMNDLVMFSIAYSVVPIYVDLYAKQGAAATAAFLERALKYYLIGVIVLCAGYAATATDLIVVLASEKYRDAGRFSPLILVGLVFLGANSLLNAGLYLQKKTTQMLVIMLAGVAANVLTNLLLLRALGTLGAAVATLIAGLATSALTIALSFRHLRLRVEAKTVAFYLALGALMLAGLSFIDFADPRLNLLVKVPLGATLVIAATLWREPELRVLLVRLRARFAG